MTAYMKGGGIRRRLDVAQRPRQAKGEKKARQQEVEVFVLGGRDAMRLRGITWQSTTSGWGGGGQRPAVCCQQVTLSTSIDFGTNPGLLVGERTPTDNSIPKHPGHRARLGARTSPDEAASQTFGDGCLPEAELWSRRAYSSA